MSYNYDGVIDHPYFYRLLAGIWYIFYLSNVFISFNKGRIPIFPNFGLTLLSIVSITYLTSVATQIEVIENSKKWLIVRMLLGLIPTMLAMFVIFRWIRNQREKNSPAIVYIGPLFLAIVLSTLSILFMIVGFLLLSIDAIPFHFLYLSIILIFWSMIGFTLGDLLKVKHLASDNLITKNIRLIFVNRNIRIIFTFFTIFILMILVIFTSPKNFLPIDTSYTVNAANYSGDIIIINNIEQLSNKVDIGVIYNGSNAPIIISTNVLNQTKQLAIEQFGVFEYFAEMVDVNDSLTNLINENSSVVYDGEILVNNSIILGFNLNSSYSLIYQKLYDPFNRGTYVISIIILESNYPIIWISNNFGWTSLIPTYM